MSSRDVTIAIHKEKRSEYGVSVPDLPGFFSAGATIEEAIRMAREAIALHFEGLREEGLPMPHPKPIEKHRTNRAFGDAVWAIVTISLPKQKRTSPRVKMAA